MEGIVSKYVNIYIELRRLSGTPRCAVCCETLLYTSEIFIP